MPYFHVVLTLPKEIAAIAFCNRRVVRHPVQDGGRDPAHHRRRSPPRRHAHRRHLRPPHLGSEAPLPSPSARGAAQRGLRRRERRVEDEQRHLARPRQGPRQLLPPPLPRGAARAHGRGKLELHGTVAHLANPGEFHATLAAARSRDWVVYAKRPFAGLAGVPIPRPLHPQDRHLGSPHRRLRRRERHLPPPQAGRAGAEEAPLRHHDRLDPEFIRRFLSMSCPRGCTASDTSASSPTAVAPRRWSARARRWAPSAGPSRAKPQTGLKGTISRTATEGLRPLPRPWRAHTAAVYCGSSAKSPAARSPSPPAARHRHRHPAVQHHEPAARFEPGQRGPRPGARPTRPRRRGARRPRLTARHGAQCEGSNRPPYRPGRRKPAILSS